MSAKGGNSNRLVHERSTYLRSAAHQIIDWYPWSSEAFRRAGEQKKPVLLDIGASWCHWCHVMDEGTYEKEEIAAFINSNYIAVKVDRDERPDIDVRYQKAVNAITGQGGWPLTVFLDSEGRPFYGGTYFPPEQVGEMPGFLDLLRRIYHYYTERTTEREEVARSVFEAVAAKQRFDEENVGAAEIRAVLQKIIEETDTSNGGFGHSPKFPHTSAVELLMALFRRGRKEARDPVKLTLDSMLAGGIHDQLGGGFHRYSTDEKWIVPHFEKMAYDNAGILRNYVHAFQLFGDAEYLKTAGGIVRFVNENLSGAEGFYASQDADAAPGDDGNYWTWSQSELAEVLDGKERKVATLYFHLHGMAEMKHSDRHVLFRAMNLQDAARSVGISDPEAMSVLDSACKKMLERRGHRPMPGVDRSVFAAWNGMMASSFFEYARCTGDMKAFSLAENAVRHYLKNSFDSEKGFRHTVSDGGLCGLLEDQVHMMHAALDLFEMTSDPAIGDVVRKAAGLLEGYCSPTGGLNDIDPVVYSGESVGLANAVSVPIYDSPVQSPNAAAAQLLLRISSVFEDADSQKAAEKIVRAVAPSCISSGAYAASIFLALDMIVNQVPLVVIAGSAEDERLGKLARTAGGIYMPGKETVLINTDIADDGSYSRTMQSIIQRTREAGRPLAFSCMGTSCSLPVEKPEELIQLLQK